MCSSDLLRRSMYVPYLTDEPAIKDEHSKTPLYHYAGRALRRLKLWTSAKVG